MSLKLKIYSQLLVRQNALYTICIGCIIFFLFHSSYFAIPSVIVLQNLSFGAFCTSSTSGTVTVSSSGTRSKTGGITLFSSNPGSRAIIQVNDNKNRVITMTMGTIRNLTDGAGHSMSLAINSFNPTSPIYMTTKQINVNIGGTLTVGTSTTTPKGNYSGSFEIIFNEQ
jgi:hypothetical protein